MIRSLFASFALATAAWMITDASDLSPTLVAEGTSKKKRPVVTLTRRVKGSEKYGTSAYSFKFATQNEEKHKGLVDLHYSTCGLVHINMYGGSESRIADVGKVKLQAVKRAPETGWLERSFVPKAGHVYVMEVIEEGWSEPVEGRERTRIEQKMTVKFGVMAVDEKQVKFVWFPIDGKQKWVPGKTSAGAGTMGTCGGVHDPR